RRAIRALKERYFAIGRERVAAVAPRGRGREREAELDRVTFSLFGMLNWVYAWYDPARHGAPHAVARTIHRVALDGLRGREPAAAHAATERALAHLELPSPIRRRGTAGGR